jgi:hypothetical protein
MIEKTDRENLIDYKNKIRVDNIWKKAQFFFILFLSIVLTLIYTTYEKFDFGDGSFVETLSIISIISLLVSIYCSYKAMNFNPNKFLSS